MCQFTGAPPPPCSKSQLKQEPGYRSQAAQAISVGRHSLQVFVGRHRNPSRPIQHEGVGGNSSCAFCCAPLPGPRSTSLCLAIRVHVTAHPGRMLQPCSGSASRHLHAKAIQIVVIIVPCCPCEAGKSCHLLKTPWHISVWLVGSDGELLTKLFVSHFQG